MLKIESLWGRNGVCLLIFCWNITGSRQNYPKASKLSPRWLIVLTTGQENMELYLTGLREPRTVTNPFSTITELTSNLTYPLGALNDMPQSLWWDNPLLHFLSPGRGKGRALVRLRFIYYARRQRWMNAIDPYSRAFQKINRGWQDKRSY
jgi:hypothetical protein